jgi:hypothetical protein
MENVNELGCLESFQRVSSEQHPNGTTSHQYNYVCKEGADPWEAYWTAINLIRKRLYNGHA